MPKSNNSTARPDKRAARRPTLGRTDDASSKSIEFATFEGSSRSEGARDRIGGLRCPHCADDDVICWGNSNGKPRYRCGSCRKTFNLFTGTQLAGLRYQDRWRDQAQALINGEPLAKAAERCGVNYTTAFRWRQKFLAALEVDKGLGLSALLSADEALILQSFESNRSAKGRRSNPPKIARKPTGKARNPICP
jgi:transposase-like protein